MHYGGFFLEKKSLKLTVRHKLSQYAFVITFFKITKVMNLHIASIAACHYKKLSLFFALKKLFFEFFYRCFSIHLDIIMTKS